MAWSNIIRLLLVIFISECENVFGADYVVPTPMLEAFRPRGFRFSLPHIEGTSFVAFHGRKNRRIANIDNGEIRKEMSKSTGNYWTFYDPDLELAIGDKIYYWVFVQFGQLGYRKDAIDWTVSKLQDFKPLPSMIDIKNRPCVLSLTELETDNKPCRNELIFSDEFDTLDFGKWTADHFIPTYSLGPNYEYNSYQNIDETRYIRESKVFLKPVTVEDVRGTLDLTDGCTSGNPSECNYTHFGSHLLPPVKSARINSQFSFKYGTMEIRAKLPEGDWIYPQITLKPTDNSTSELRVAYSRGNENLADKTGNHIGSKILYGGIKKDGEQLSEFRSFDMPFNLQFHTYTLKWQPGKITVKYDGDVYGVKTIQFDKWCTITLGVGVGGVVEFPDSQWSELDAKSIFNFNEQKNEWESTWKDENSALQIDYVKVYAL